MKIARNILARSSFTPLRIAVPRSFAVASLMGAIGLASVGCNEKSDVHAVRAKAAKPVPAAPAAVDPKVAQAVAAAAQVARPARPASKDAPPLPPGHGNTLPPGHPPIAGMAAPAGAANQVPAGKVHAAAAAPTGSANPDGTKAGPSGPVAEVLQAGRYTYLRIGKAWSAVPMAKVQVGQDVAIVGAMKMTNFVSKATGRTFPEVWFGNLAVAKGAAVAPAAKTGAPSAAIKVAKASGERAMTVADVHAKQAALGGKRVRIQGKVVKFNAEILGRNWLHLQDGSGDVGAKTHDLTVTSSARAKVGDIVTIEGVVALNSDFGSGYKYAVLVEKATVTPASN